MIKRYYIVVKNRERTELIRFFGDGKKGTTTIFPIIYEEDLLIQMTNGV